jgi:hypothetical protein
MTTNGNHQEEAIMPPAAVAPSAMPSRGTDAVDPQERASREMEEVDEILVGLTNLDPADATVPAARVAELLGAALDREGR